MGVQLDDYLASVGFGEDGVTRVYPETHMDDVAAAVALDDEIPAAKIAVLETELATKDGEIQALKAANHDLMMQIPRGDSDAGESVDEDDDPDDEGSNITPDDLFGDNKEDKE